MSRVGSIVSILLFVGAGVCFSLGMYSLGEREDLPALYWLVVGALVLKASVDLLKPRSAR